MLVVLMTSFAADKWITNAQLSLPLLITAVCATATAAVGIPLLRRLKMGQFIREEGPKAHQSKAGTPTMGGLLVVPVGVVLGSLITRDAVASQQLLSLAALTLAFMLIGGIDDWSSLTKHTNTGLTARGKLLLQAMAAAAFLAIAAWQGWISSSIALPFGLELPLGLLIWPLGLFVVLAESNATNLTDGLDGLASGCGALVFTGLALQLMLRGEQRRSCSGWLLHGHGWGMAWVSRAQPKPGSGLHGRYGIPGDGGRPQRCGPVVQQPLAPSGDGRRLPGRIPLRDHPSLGVQGHERT